MNYQYPEYQTHQVKVEKPKSSNKFKRFLIESLKFLGIFLFFFLISATIIMWPTVIANVQYYFVSDDIKESNENLGLPVASIDYSSIAPVVEDREKENQYVNSSESRVVIPKINVDAPIVFMDSKNNEDILEAIKNGVAHYAGTAMPGRIGNTFLTGHSSYYWWSGGQYNQVFALLNRLEANDLVYIYHKNGIYVYRVRTSIVVNPSQTEVLDPTPTPTLSLMTCVPLGTNLRRLIVKADLISTPPVDYDQLDSFVDIPQIPIILPL